MRIPILILIALVFQPHAWVYAHGVSYSIGRGGMVINAAYDDGTPMSYAEAEIIQPDSDLPFASGWTDRNGRFCFLPDTKGDYNIKIDDGMGHMIKFTLPVSENIKQKTPQKEILPINSTLLRYQKIFLGLAIIVFVFGLVFWIKGRRLIKYQDSR